MTILGLYTGTSVSSLVTVAGNDDESGLLTSLIVADVVGGQEYRIAVDGYNGQAGSINLSVMMDVPLVNCAHMVGHQLVLTWGTNWTGYVLEYCTNLTGSAQWNQVSPGPVVVGGMNTVSNIVTGASKFYRLRRQ